MSEGDLFQLRVVMANRYLGGVQWTGVVTLGFQAKGDDDVLATLGDDWIANVGAVWFAPLTVDTFLDHVEVWRLTGGTDEPVFTVPTVELHGSVSGLVVPHQVAALIRWRADIVGRAYEGRSYLYGFPCARTVFGNFWDETALTQLRDIGDQMLFTYGAAGASDLVTFVVVSREVHGELRDEPLATPVAEYDAVELIATQRRRLYLLPE